MQSNDPYQSPDAFSADAAPKTSGYAISSLVLSLLFPIGLCLTALPGLILGIVALFKINASGGQLKGTTLAIIGTVLSGLQLLVVPFVLVALLLPAVQAARGAAQRASTMNDMRMIELGTIMHEAAKGHLPAPRSASGLSWRVHLLPQIEQEALFNEFHLDEPWDSEHNRALIPRMPEIYQVVGLDLPEGKTSYCLVTGPGTAYEGPTSEPVTTSFRDGAARTITLVQVDPSQAVTWTQPEDWELDQENPMKGLYFWPGREFLAGFADGHVQSISEEIDPATLRSMFLIDDGQ